MQAPPFSHDEELSFLNEGSLKGEHISPASHAEH